jgi:hypothetical protein
MLNFFYGVAFMYLLAIPLLAYVVDSVDEEDHTANWRFAFMWPVVALEVIVRILIGDKSDGTGTD